MKPAQVTLVPDDIRQSTSDHGWNIGAHQVFLKAIIARLKGAGMRVSLFIDAVPDVAHLAAEVGADRVEIFTGPYGGALDPGDAELELEKVVMTGNAASDAGHRPQCRPRPDAPATCRRSPPPFRISPKSRSATR